MSKIKKKNEKLIPLSKDVDYTSVEVRDLMYTNLLTKGVSGVIPSMDAKALSELILKVPDRSGMNGWTLVPAVTLDNNRCVLKMAGWLLNDGTPPPSNMYLGYTGLVSDISEAINIRGQAGLTTDVTINGKTYAQINGNILLPNLLPVAHDISAESHYDIRKELKGLQTLLESDDKTLDELSEIVAYIKANKTLIESVTTSKISISDIENSLLSANVNKPLSANMGKELKAQIDKKRDKGDYATNTSVEQKISAIQMPDVLGNIGIHNLSTVSHSDIRQLVNTKQDKGDYVLTNDVRLTDERSAKYGLFGQYPQFNSSNIFANPPLNALPSGIHHFTIYGDDIPGAPIAGGVWFNVTIEMSAENRAYQKVSQMYSGDRQRMWYRMRHMDTNDYTIWQPWQLVINDSDINILKLSNRSLWDTLKGYYIYTDTSNANMVIEKLHQSGTNLLQATLTTTFGANITEVLSVVGGTTTTKTITFNGNIINESIT